MHPDRETAMSRLARLTSVLGFVLLGLTALTPSLARAKPPNVVLIISDDQGWGDYSFMGHPHIRTPRIDRLATQSLAFRRGYVPYSLCSPSLATILTGLYPHQHGVTGNDPAHPLGKPVDRAKRQELVSKLDRPDTLTRLLATAGYASFQAGKWWGGSYATAGFTEGMTHGDPDRGGRHGDEGLRIGRRTMAPVLDFIDRSTESGKPFFLWYAPMMPHLSHNPPKRLHDRYRELAPTDPIARYWAMCEWFDETCGKLLDHLDARGVADETLVIFLADNGWIQDPEAESVAPRSKQSPYDGGLRTPILVRWPGKVAPRRSEALASSLDIVPTVLAAAGVKPPEGLPGLNLLDDKAVSSRRAIFGELFTHDIPDLDRPAAGLRFRWVIEGDWKLILPDPLNEPKAHPELFNLARDPNETTNLAGREPDRVAHLTRLIESWWPDGHAAP
jgi:uncharacterized sulfatase